MQCDNANQYILRVYDRQKLHRGWRCFHLFHCLYCHCIRTNGSRLPEITQRLLKICSGRLCHSLLSFKIFVCVSVCVFTSRMLYIYYDEELLLPFGDLSLSGKPRKHNLTRKNRVLGN
jgi:hypothetical protein